MDIQQTTRGHGVAGLEVEHARTLVVTQAAWMTLAFGVLHLLGAFTLENYYVLSYFGLVTGAQLFAPVDRTKRWWRAVRWALRLGFLVLCYFVAVRAIEVVQV